MNDHTLTCENLTIGYETALGDPLNFTVPPGSVLAVVGPSGCGKSTLLSTIAGVIPAHSGRVLIDGVDVTQMPTHTRTVAMVFQEPLLFPTMTVRDNVAYGPRRSGASASDARSTAEELLSWVDLARLGDRNVDQLSGGQAQRVSLARALAADPAVLCLDEPFSALDAPLRSRLAADVLALVRRTGIPAVHVTHD
ncbi:MAG: ATP-binding cassette domain-containing protein, partial [Actinobacteria bacterium]|nr:ATP-binding cassette domain-containing protein [Actinomycetota bacterium]